MSIDGKTVINEKNERQFYENYLKVHYKGDYLLPTWQAVCRERKFCYDKKISNQEMMNGFASYLNNSEEAA